tara:strand:- start:59 stop:403 length:345 start_codon:yes stop_codon:yes gene_type:complete
MQKEIFKEDYFGTLMCILVDEARRIMPTFKPDVQAYKIQNDMCKVGSWVDQVPSGIIIETVPQASVQKLQQQCLPEYRRLAAKLIEHFIISFVEQGGNQTQIEETYGKRFIWKQ